MGKVDRRDPKFSGVFNNEELFLEGIEADVKTVQVQGFSGASGIVYAWAIYLHGVD